MDSPSEERTAKILVVDDNEANRALAKDTLEDEGYQVVLAESGGRGLELFESAAPDCVILDVRMPDMDGFVVCERLRAMPRGPETPVVFLTALRDVDTFDRALRAGGDDFLTKPVRPTELVIRVQTALQLRRLRSEAREHFGILKKQRDDLMRLQLQKERLMAFVVHDLKNPVNSMDLYAQLLLREKSTSESAREAGAQIRMAARQLSRMILNLLDLSKADEGKLEPKWTSLRLPDVVGAVLADLEATAQNHRVTLRSVINSDTLEGDEDLIRRMLANLVENAIRHSPPDGTVTVCTHREGDDVILAVADSGSGIPVELRERIFDPFVQLEAESGATRGGRGLGLAFCKLVAEAHGGGIEVGDAEVPPSGPPESTSAKKVSRGASFRVRLPSVGPAAAAGPRSAKPGVTQGAAR